MMMYKKHPTLLLALFLIFSIGFVQKALAQEGVELKDSDGDGIFDSDDNCPLLANPDQSDYDADGIGNWCEADEERFGFKLQGGTAPDSFFYFFDSLAEKLSLIFTFDSGKKAEKALKYAREKLAEMQVMTAEGNEKAAQKANENYGSLMKVVSSHLEKSGAKESLVGEATRTINAHKSIVNQHGREKWGSLQERVSDVQLGFLETFEAPPFPTSAPLALSSQERRERLCQTAKLRPVKDETSKVFDMLCAGDFSAGTSAQEKKNILYTTLFEAIKRNDISDRTKILLHQIIFTHLPEEKGFTSGAFLRRILADTADIGSYLALAQGSIFDPASGQEAGSQAREDQFINEVQQAIAKAKQNCPAPGYSSYTFIVSCSINDFVTGQSYSDEYAESGGPCKYDEMGSVERTHISSDLWDYSGGQSENGEAKRSREIVCDVMCASHNCAQHGASEQERKKCEPPPPVYYLAGKELTDEMLENMCSARGVSDQIVSRPGLIGRVGRGLGKLFGGGGGEERINQGDGTERVITTQNCVLSDCDEIELEFAWGKEKVKSCCCSCAGNDEVHKSRNIFDAWDWDGDSLIDRILKNISALPKPIPQTDDTTSPTVSPKDTGSQVQTAPPPVTDQPSVSVPATEIQTSADSTTTSILPAGDHVVSVYHKCNVTEGRNGDGKFEARVRAEISVPEVKSGSQVIYPKTNPVESRTGICSSDAPDVPVCQDPRYSSEPEYAQSKSFTYTEEYKYPANALKNEIDRIVQGDMAFMTGKRPCSSSELSPVGEQSLGNFEIYDTATWLPVSTIPVPGKSHFVAATDGTPDVRNYLPIKFELVRGQDQVIWYTFIDSATRDCRGADGCSVDGPQLGSEYSGNPFRLEARGKNGELLAKHTQ